MKRSLAAFFLVSFFASTALLSAGCAPDAGKIYSEKKSKAENERLKERVVELEKEVESLKAELKNCLEKRIKSLETENQ
jgi:cell division protein FtsB